MRIVVIGQEEPVYFSPFLRSIIDAKHKEVVLVVIAGGRGQVVILKVSSRSWKIFISCGLLWSHLDFCVVY